MTDARRWIPQVINVPRTQTVLALGVLGAAIWQGQIDWNTALAMVLTFYFTKEQVRREVERAGDR